MIFMARLRIGMGRWSWYTLPMKTIAIAGGLIVLLVGVGVYFAFDKSEVSPARAVNKVFSIDGDKVYLNEGYYNGEIGTSTLVEVADAETFVSVNEYAAKDAQHTYDISTKGYLTIDGVATGPSWSEVDAIEPQAQAQAPELIFKVGEVEFFAAGDEVREPGTGSKKSIQTPYLKYGSEEVAVLDASIAPDVQEYKFSPSGQFLYVSNGMLIQDAAVTLYIFDTETRTLHKVCVATEDCSGYTGFPSQEKIQVSWLSDNRLRIVYDNPFVAVGGSEDRAVGLQTFTSASAETPWEVTVQ
jgi:hypothetical protein